VYRTYNLGGSQTTTLRELVELISAAVGVTPQIMWQPEQPGDMKRTLSDLTHVTRELGYQPKVAITDGIPRFVSWFRGLGGVH
jgi:UDP-glucuronate 4-epimerase